LLEVVDFLKNPERFHKVGAKIPKGALLVGPPGTGKTLLARAVAGEAGVSFLHTSGSDFVEMFVGMGASRVRDLFEQARKAAPCIIFIDELDAVGRARGSGLGGGHDEREQTLNQILTEMDGFDTVTNVIVMGATNRPDVLDQALLRPGRFDRQVVVDLPDIKEREAILKIHCKKIKLEKDVDLSRIARATPGSSGADLANMINEAALFAARENKITVSMDNIENARDKVMIGVAKPSKFMTDEDKKATAYHEAGHTLLHYYLSNVDPLHKVTIIPHGRALGLTISLPERDTYTLNKSKLVDRIKITMGGYVAEEIVYGETTTGTSNDIQQATNIAKRMVTEFGMSSLGFINLGDEKEPIFLGREIAQHKNFSEATAKIIDEEMLKILKKCMNETRDILVAHRDELDLLTKELVDKETLSDAEIRKLLGFEATDNHLSIK
jgi:cell division protease FtsH